MKPEEIGPTWQIPAKELTAQQAWQERAEWIVVLYGLPVDKNLDPKIKERGEIRIKALTAQLKMLNGDTLPPALQERIQPTLDEWAE